MWLRLAVAAAATMTALSAQNWEVGAVGGFLRLSTKPLGSTNLATPKDDDNRLHGHQPAYGLRATWDSKGYFGIDATYLRSKARIDSNLIALNGSATQTLRESGRISVNQVFLNGISYFMPNGERFRPYVTGGLAVQIYTTPPLPDWPFGRSRRTGFNWGGGVKWQLQKHFIMRLDVRQILGGSPYDLQYNNNTSDQLRSPGIFKQFQATLGVGVRF